MRKNMQIVLLVLICWLPWIFAFVYSFDTATPLGSDKVSTLDDKIREVKAAVQERENVDHYWPLTGTQVSDASVGKHRKTQFYGVLAVKPTLLTGECAIYSKTVSGISELFFEDSGGTEKQLSTNGKLNVAATEAVLLTGNQTVAGVKTFSSAPKSSANATATGELVRFDQADDSTLQILAGVLQLKDSGTTFAKLATGGVRMATGTYTGTGVASRAITGVGFQPSIVFLFDLTHGSAFGWGCKTANMATFTHYAAAGWASQIIVSLDADGFTLGTNHAFVNNADGRTYNWIAIGIK